MVEEFDGESDVASVLVPIKITDGALTSVTAGGVALPEDASPAWSAATTYAIGQRVYLTSTHKVYESLKDGNLNKNPENLPNQFSSDGTPQWWFEIGPTNKWAMFDGLINTPTAGNSPLVVTLRPGPFNGLALFGLDGDSYSIVARNSPGGAIIYDSGADVPLEGSMPGDYYEYFFSPFKPLTQLSVSNIQPYGSAEITITVKKSTGLAKIGMLSIGDLKPIGVPERNSSVEPKTYAYIAEDAYGNVSIKRRPSAVNLSMQIKVALEDADDITQTIQDLLDVPVAFVGSQHPLHTKLSTFGLLSGRMDYSTYPDRTLTVTMKGFT